MIHNMTRRSSEPIHTLDINSDFDVCFRTPSVTGKIICIRLLPTTTKHFFLSFFYCCCYFIHDIQRVRFLTWSYTKHKYTQTGSLSRLKITFTENKHHKWSWLHSDILRERTIWSHSQNNNLHVNYVFFSLYSSSFFFLLTRAPQKHFIFFFFTYMLITH